MKKWFIAFIAVLLILPAFASTVLANEIINDSEVDKKYEIEFTIYDEARKKVSASDNFFEKEATLLESDGAYHLQITTTANQYIDSLSNKYGEFAKVGGDEEGEYTYQFKLDAELTEDQLIDMVISVPGIYDGQEYTTRLAFDLDTKVEITEDEEGNEDSSGSDPGDEPDKPEEEPEQPEEPEKEPEEDSNDQGDKENKLVDSDDKFEVNYVSDLNLSRNFENPVTVVVKDGKKYIQMNGSGAQYVDSLTINGEEVTWGPVDDKGNYTIQFEVNSLTDTQNFSMYLSTPMGEMEHHAKLSFDNGETREVNVTKDEEILIISEDVITIGDNAGVSLVVPNDLSEPIVVNVNELQSKDLNNLNDLKVAGQVIDFDFNDFEFNGEQFKLVMNYDTTKFDADEVDIYYYNEDSGEWVKQDGNVKNGKITIYPEHFSIYGVFAVQDEEPITEVVEEMNYIIYDETGEKISAANGFFEKPANVIQRDGTYYVQIATNANQFIDSLSNENGEFEYIGENEAGHHVYEFRLIGELSDDQLIDMVITVPGMYDGQEYSTRLVLDVEDRGGLEPQPEPGNEPEPGRDPAPEPEPEPGNPLDADRAYEIDFVIYDESGNKVSASNGFFENPAILLEKDGVYYVQITTNSNQYIDSLSNRFGEFVRVGGDENGVFTYQFRVDGDLTTEQIIDMVISVPGIYDGQEYTTRLVLDPDSMVEVNAEEYQLVAAEDNSNGPNEDGTNNLDPKTPGKPKLGEGENNEDGAGAETDRNALNPQTGENTNILLYVLLLIGSAIPLAIQVKRRFA